MSLRRTVLATAIGSFAIAALLGIYALIVPGEFGQTQGNVLLTTVIIGAASVAALCYLAAAELPSGGVRLLALAGGVLAVVATVAALWLTWGQWYDEETYESLHPGLQEGLVKTLAVAGILAGTIAQCCLLITVAHRRLSPVREIVAVTLICAAAVAGLLCVVILSEDGGEGLARVIGVLAILDVLGTLTVVALSKFSDVGSPTPELKVPVDLVAAVDAHAARTGQDRVDIVRAALSEYLRHG